MFNIENNGIHNNAQTNSQQSRDPEVSSMRNFGVILLVFGLLISIPLFLVGQIFLALLFSPLWIFGYKKIYDSGKLYDRKSALDCYSNFLEWFYAQDAANRHLTENDKQRHYEEWKQKQKTPVEEDKVSQKTMEPKEIEIEAQTMTPSAFSDVPQQKVIETKHPETPETIHGKQSVGDDSSLYKKAFDEIENGQASETLWIKALTETEGDEDKAKYHYIALRVRQLAAGTYTQNTKNDETQEHIDVAPNVDMGQREIITELLHRWDGLLREKRVELAAQLLKNLGESIPQDSKQRELDNQLQQKLESILQRTEFSAPVQKQVTSRKIDTKLTSKNGPLQVTSNTTSTKSMVRPMSITAIGWALIVLSVLALVAWGGMIGMVATSDFMPDEAYEFLVIAPLAVSIQLAIGIGILKGKRWARNLYLWLVPINIALVFISRPESAILPAVIYAFFAYLLSRPAARMYFDFTNTKTVKIERHGMNSYPDDEEWSSEKQAELDKALEKTSKYFDKQFRK